jgi:hypothetical protein
VADLFARCRAYVAAVIDAAAATLARLGDESAVRGFLDQCRRRHPQPLGGYCSDACLSEQQTRIVISDQTSQALPELAHYVPWVTLVKQRSPAWGQQRVNLPQQPRCFSFIEHIVRNYEIEPASFESSWL